MASTRDSLGDFHLEHRVERLGVGDAEVGTLLAVVRHSCVVKAAPEHVVSESAWMLQEQVIGSPWIGQLVHRLSKAFSLGQRAGVALVSHLGVGRTATRPRRNELEVERGACLVGRRVPQTLVANRGVWEQVLPPPPLPPPSGNGNNGQ